VYARGYLWLIIGADVVSIDPTSLAAGQAIHVGSGGAAALAAGNGALWSVTHAGSLKRLVPDGGGTNLALGIPRSLADVAVGGGGIWVAVSARS
jgi:hypothetical protein